MDEEIHHLTRCARRWRAGAVFAPLGAAMLVCPAFLAISELRYGNGFIGPLVWLFFGCAAFVPMALPTIIARSRGAKRGFHGAFWPALGGILGALPLTLQCATVNLSSDAQAGIALIWGPALSIKWAALGALVGLGLTFVKPFQFRLFCEWRLDALRCRACEYSFAGLESSICPECGAGRP